MRERSSFKLIHTVGLDQDQVDGFGRQVGPVVKAAASAVGRRLGNEIDEIRKAAKAAKGGAKA